MIALDHYSIQSIKRLTMDHKPTARARVRTMLTTQFSGALTAVALSALSAWLIVTGLKGAAGFTITRQSALADLLGIILVIAVVRWMSPKRDAK
jgi:hypothetical protein